MDPSNKDCMATQVVFFRNHVMNFFLSLLSFCQLYVDMSFKKHMQVICFVIHWVYILHTDTQMVKRFNVNLGVIGGEEFNERVELLRCVFIFNIVWKMKKKYLRLASETNEEVFNIGS